MLYLGDVDTDMIPNDEIAPLLEHSNVSCTLFLTPDPQRFFNLGNFLWVFVCKNEL